MIFTEPGTLEERGVIAWRTASSSESASDRKSATCEPKSEVDETETLSEAADPGKAKRDGLREDAVKLTERNRTREYELPFGLLSQSTRWTRCVPFLPAFEPSALHELRRCKAFSCCCWPLANRRESATTATSPQAEETARV